MQKKICNEVPFFSYVWCGQARWSLVVAREEFHPGWGVNWVGRLAAGTECGHPGQNQRGCEIQMQDINWFSFATWVTLIKPSSIMTITLGIIFFFPYKKSTSLPRFKWTE